MINLAIVAKFFDLFLEVLACLMATGLMESKNNEPMSYADAVARIFLGTKTD
jgi:hypothetical protein